MPTQGNSYHINFYFFHFFLPYISYLSFKTCFYLLIRKKNQKLKKK